MKGIILAGGKGARLYPLTISNSKQLLPVYDKPMIYYPLSLLLQAGLKEVLVITAPEPAQAFRRLLGDGERFGIRLSYRVQQQPQGIAQALLLGEDFLAGDTCCLILGDNLFHGGPGFAGQLRALAQLREGATVFAYPMADPRPFGVVELAADGRVLSLEEKPEQPKANTIVPGLYFYDQTAPALAGQLRPSGRGELEITDLNRAYLAQGRLRAEPLPPELLWFDTGTAEALFQAAAMVRRIQREENRLIGCPEAAAYESGLLDKAGLAAAGLAQQNTGYGRYLLALAGALSAKPANP